VDLFSESVARAIVAVHPDHEARVAALCASVNVPVRRLGTVGGDAFTVENQFSIPLVELREVYQGALPSLFA
jgi:phosphoribosylformylglycinamidine (FGAM) synthase-like enzyme